MTWGGVGLADPGPESKGLLADANLVPSPVLYTNLSEVTKVQLCLSHTLVFAKHLQKIKGRLNLFR